MRCEIIIDPAGEERVLIHARQESELTRAICRLVEEHSIELIGYNERQSVRLSPSDIVCVTIEGERVYALCKNERLQLRQRLYVLEELLGEGFVRINQSCLANVRWVERFDASVSGTLKVRFANGHTDYVSRRQLKRVKERFGIS